MESPFKAMVALKQSGRVEAQAVIERMKARFPVFTEHPAPRVIEVSEADRAGHDVQYIGLGSLVIELIFLDGPMFQAIVDDAAARSVFWPEAAATLAGHGGHAMVSAALPKIESGNDAVLIAGAVTFACAALADLMPAVAVLWRESQSLVQMERFQAGAEELKAGNLPVNLWVSFEPIRGQEAWYGRKSGTCETTPVGFLTTGLYPFVQREAEFLPVDRRPGDTALYTDIACRAILVRGGEVPDGDVIKVNKTEQVWLRRLPEGQRPGLPVWAMMLEPESMPAGKPAAGGSGDAAKTGAAQQDAGCKFMGILALARIEAFEPRQLVGQLQKLFPAYKGHPIEFVDRPARDPAMSDKHWFRAGDVVVKINLVPAPIFPTVLEAAVQAAKDWPDAGRQLADHRAQMVVELFSPAGGTTAGRLDAAFMAMMFCSALADQLPARAIYWKSGGTITDPARFRQRTEKLLEGDLPYDILVQVNRLRNSPFVSTTGLRDLLGRETEFRVDGLTDAEAMARAHMVCRQLVAHGDSLRDGEPIPFDADEEILPRALIEGQREDIPVWSLTFGERRDSAAGPGREALARPFAGEASPAGGSASGQNAPSEPTPRRSIQQMPRGRPGGDKCETGSFTAFLALDRPASIRGDDLIERMRALFPQLQSRIVTPAEDGEPKAPDAPLVFFMGDSMIMVMFIDQPMPPGTMTVAARASRGWPEAETKLAAHRGHVIVHASAKTKDRDGALNAAQNVSVVSATLADLLPTIGVYWSQGWVVTTPDEFIRSTEHILQRKFSGASGWFQLWFLGGPPTDKGESTMAILTTGLEPFLGREIELLPSAQPREAILHRLLVFLEYLLSHGLVMDEGDTGGVSYDEFIRAHYADEGQRPGIPVIQLTIEQIDENVPAFAGGGTKQSSGSGSEILPAIGHAGTGSGDKLEKFTTYILLKDAPLVDDDRFNECLQARFPELQASRWRRVEVMDRSERFAFDMDGHEVGIMFVNGPSRADMVAPALRAGGAWPEAEKDLAGHQGCLVVHADPLGDDWTTAVNCARVVTAVSAVLAEIQPAIGVTWSEADRLIKASEFVETAPKVLAGNYARAGWVRRWTVTDTGQAEGEWTVAMGTVGLAALIGREIEMAPAAVDAATMAKRLLGAIQYVLTKGPVLKDGGALKVSETERLRIRLADQGGAPGLPVYRLTLEMPGREETPRDPAAMQEPARQEQKPKKPLFGRRGTS